jgi:urease accessory protein
VPIIRAGDREAFGHGHDLAQAVSKHQCRDVRLINKQLARILRPVNEELTRLIATAGRAVRVHEETGKITMLDTYIPIHQRSKGTARVVLGHDGAVVDLFQQGSAKAILPRVHTDVPEVVFLNTSGGLTGGDRLSFCLDIADETTVMAATQTAERAYASSGGSAEVDVDIRVGSGAFCLWMPQETILFESASMQRKTRVTLAEGARYLGVETLVIGRAAMGEVPRNLDFSDLRQVFLADGVPLHAEHIALTSNTLLSRENRAGLAGNTVFASLVYVAPDAQDHLEHVRRIANATAVVSAWGNRLVVRVEGCDSWDVRHTLVPIIKALGINHVPRVWQT